MPNSYNGWPADPDPNAIGIDPGFRAAGVPFPGGAKAGDVATVLGYVIEQLAARVEPLLINPDTGQPGYGCWGYNYRANVNNPSSLSCHSSGTALDFSAPSHPNGASGTFSDAQVATIYDILAECGGAVQWGGDYSGTVDEMHFEIIVDAGYLAEVAASLPTGSSGGGELPPSPEGDWFDMATEEDLRRIVGEELDNRGLNGTGINDVVANVLRAPEFDLEAQIQHDRIFTTVTEVMHAEEFDLGATRRDTRDTKADTSAILDRL
jgi:D-alanyl-D-alanine carboxypeptidase